MVYLNNQAWAVQAPHGRISLLRWNKCAWTCSQASKTTGLILSSCWNHFLCHLIPEDLRRKHYLNQWKLEKLKYRGFLHLNNLHSLKYVVLLFSSQPEAWSWAWLSISHEQELCTSADDATYQQFLHHGAVLAGSGPFSAEELTSGGTRKPLQVLLHSSLGCIRLRIWIMGEKTVVYIRAGDFKVFLAALLLWAIWSFLSRTHFSPRAFWGFLLVTSFLPSSPNYLYFSLERTKWIQRYLGCCEWG